MTAQLMESCPKSVFYKAVVARSLTTCQVTVFAGGTVSVLTAGQTLNQTNIKIAHARGTQM